jgi:hypothetical protein
MRILRKLLKILAWVAGSFVALVLVLYLVVLAINWRDRPPSEAALRFVAAYRDRPAVADADNAYVYASGFFVKPGDDPQAAGLRRISWLWSVSREPPPADGGYLSPTEKDYDYKAARSSAVRELSEACREQDPACALAMERGSATIVEWLSSERWLFERYQTLIARPGWLETAPIGPQMTLPPYGAVMDGQRLLFLQAWTRAGERDAAAVRNLLSQDIRFWRHTLESSDILISRMIAVAGLRRHFKFGNVVLRRLPAELESAARPPEWAAELTLAERSMMRTWVGEWMYLSRALEQTGPDQWLDERASHDNVVQRLIARASVPLLQRQDLANQYAESFVRANAELDVAYERYEAGVTRAEEILRGAEWGRELPPLRIYNPMGAVLRWINGWQYVSYSQRVVDIEGVRRAALLTSELRSRGVAAAQVGAELSASAVRDPYTGEPFGWDAEKGVLKFFGLDEKAPGLHEFTF